MAVRKNFNAAAVNEIDVVVELVYKVRNKGTFSSIEDAECLAWVSSDCILQIRRSD